MLHKGPHCGDVTATIIGSNKSKFCENYHLGIMDWQLLRVTSYGYRQIAEDMQNQWEVWIYEIQVIH